MSANGGGYSGYHQAKSYEIDEELACVGPGTPCGEYMRRLWHPVAMTSQVGDLPLALRRLGEDLVLFRDKRGRLGLVHKHCPHRNASLEFGIVNERGLRCCYHGWLFDVDGTLLEAPAESDSERLSAHVRLGAYPVREYKGLVFAYMGPPEETPPFPVYDTFEIEGGELVPYEVTMPCNWLQVAENSMDPMHVVFLHTRVNQVQFSEKLGTLPVIDWHGYEIGLFYTKGRRVGDYIWISTNDLILPNFTQAGAVFENTEGKEPKYFGRSSFSRWIVPVDDTHCTVLAFRHFNPRAEAPRDEWRTPEALEKIDISELRDRPYEERQRNPGDFEAFFGQGPITAHKRERLVSSDRGVAMYRQRLKREMRRLQAGERPLQPADYGANPIPPYGSDTVIRRPLAADGDAEAAIKALLVEVGKAYRGADAINGEARYEALARELATLNR